MLETNHRRRNVAARRAAVALATIACATALVPLASAQQPDRLRTYANPIDLPYRYQAPYPPFTAPRVPFREAADPMVIRFKGEYWMFVSHSLGYWHSRDLQDWRFVAARGYAVDMFAPTVVEINGRLYLATSENVPQIWTTDDPASGEWHVAATLAHGYQDPALFLDDDGRLYVFDGLSPDGPLHAAELDRTTFRELRTVAIPQARDKQHRGWEVPGNHNELVNNPSYIEGAWMTKHGGRYYLEYSGPGTEFHGYANGLLTAANPMGPFTYQSYSPFAVKATGFITGAGHGGTFQGADDRWWHVGTMTISVRHIFERRLGLFPTTFTPQGEVFTDTYLGDYPHYYDGDRGPTGWMLLSYRKKATASSSLLGFGPERAADEDIRSWWSATSGKAGEWYQLDLGATKRIEALQINHADQDARTVGASDGGYRYRVEVSLDGRRWTTIIPEATTGRDAPHAYHVLPNAILARYVRVRNVHTPDGGRFSLYDLRVFGTADGPRPAAVTQATAVRDAADGRRARLGWSAAMGAQFYIVRLGVRPDLLTQNFQVDGGRTTLDIASLNVGTGYVFTIDTMNEAGITKGTVFTAVR